MVFLKLNPVLVLIVSLSFVVQGQTTKTEQEALSPQAVLDELLAGNKKYTDGKILEQDIKKRIAKTTKSQHPKAVILSCIDSRVSVELVFNQGIGDVFVGRVAGNIENEDQLGSMEYAAKFAGSKVVMVLGHTSCGAIKGACDGIEVGNLTTLLKKMKPAVKGVKGHEKEGRNSKNKQFVNEVVKKNVILTVKDIRQRSAVLADLEKAGKIIIVGAVYDIETGKVSLVSQ